MLIIPLICQHLIENVNVMQIATCLNVNLEFNQTQFQLNKLPFLFSQTNQPGDNMTEEVKTGAPAKKLTQYIAALSGKHARHLD